jgi:signal transduction histidine kinase
MSFFAIYLVYYTTGILSYHSRWSLDITSDIDFDIFRLTSLLIFIAVFVVYFINSHLIFRILIKLNSNSLRSILYKFIIGGFIYAILSDFVDEIHWSVVVINIFYFLILYFLNLPRTIGTIKYSTYIYFLVCAFSCSSIAAYSIYKQNLKESIFDRQHYANDLLFKNDVFGEFLLNVASHEIENDEFIKTRLITPLTSKGLIEYKIKKAYLPNYFDKYDIVISVFDYHGNVFEKNSEFLTFKDAENFYKRKKYKTEFSNIYFVRDPETGARKYVCFTNIYINDILVGYVLIELKHKKYVPHSVYPELLMNNVSDKPYEPKSYNYAVYSNGKLMYSFGNYNYQSNFNKEWLEDNDLFKEGITDQGYHHIGLMAPDGKKIVVSADKYYFKRIFSNFSFFFLILTLFTLIFIIFYAQNFSNVKINATYATKIQIYLNIAFFLPLLIVSVTTLSIISVSYRDSLNHSFVNKAEDISAHISGYFHDNKIDTEKEDMDNILMEISKFTETDINVYSNKGRLLFTNQPMIFDLGFLSKLINPYAYSSLIENSASTLMIPEQLGDLKYNCVYVSIRSIEDNELLGILSMPFFESKNELDKQIIHVLTTIVNIFVTIFILFLVLSYFASHVLTVPLKIITQKLRKTTLDKNEPIEWQTKDEIGMLVGEYNSMLVKLEESKNALSKSEKESAWREMAKQVAHEIKNPLTPMKLTIQHLQRSVDTQDQDLAGKTKKALMVLLDQVNNLNEIATSFSMFAKMPIPKTERFEIASVLSKTAALHNNNKDVNVHTDIKSGHYFVIGDEQLMSGIFTNLILNGIQSVPNGRTAEIYVRLSQVDSKVLIEVKDNGTGIPVSIREKVFLPNFSTKYSGSGIGLAVAKRGVEHAGGRIWFETMEETGTSFFIEIPLTN